MINTNIDKTDIEIASDSDTHDIPAFAEADDIDLNPKLVDNVLKELELFEKNKDFLKKRVSLESLSLQCGTNTAYLSKIINHYKKQNFKAYVNDLRLHYVMNLWTNHKKSRKYSIQDIAGKSGFSNAQSFSKKFQEKFGVSPSSFLKQFNSNMELENEVRNES
ncbi:MAG: helix-turn-helix transcriptional regulator [Chryseobacterium sp.]|uniref:helix-turn-helix domain-containing protein n=1 Tax=Chryseobacterium sp. TaxID=1871047 RepID=UPI0025BCD190|nr:helix-turn-helix transcriptional regulator [Chryseobacterium sp.]MCJ7934889.1 helix-turn-helix transcriptional regulator [Chryseobacterium sp.]